MKFGAHVSIAGGIDLAPGRASAISAEVFQIFSRSPRGGKALVLGRELVRNFKQACRKYGFENYYIHTPYYINLASKKNRICFGSTSVIREDLERGSMLGARFVVTHLGSAKDLGKKKAIEKVIEGIDRILKYYQGSTKLLLELTAGSGEIIGDRFEEMAVILDKLCKESKKRTAGVCFDTAHVFASGYDLRNKEAVVETLKEFDRVIGLERLKLLHLNDSLTPLGSHVDRHAHIGKGKIGIKGFQAIVNHPYLKKLDGIIETPYKGKGPDLRKEDIRNLKTLRRLIE